MKVTITPPPQPVPQPTVTIQMSEQEARALRTIHGDIIIADGPLGKASLDFYHALSDAGVQRIQIESSFQSDSCGGTRYPKLSSGGGK